MAGQGGASDVDRELWQDALVENLRPDPSQGPNAVALTGWLGKSTRDGYWRLYFTPQLDEYVEFKEEDVLRSQSLGSEQTEGRTTLWVKRGASLEHTRTASRQVQAEFLKGELAASFLAGTVGERGLADIQEAVARHPPTVGACRTEQWQCTERLVACPTAYRGC